MTSSTFEPTDLAHLGDPYAALAELRGVAPIVRLQSGFWAVTGYEAAMEIFRHRACASGPIAQRYVTALPPGAARDEMSTRINFLDPPDHTRVRSLVSKAFTPRRVGNLIPWIATTAEHLVDELDAERELDLLHRFAHQLPSLVISELLGVPSTDRDQLTAWSDAVAPLLGLDLGDAIVSVPYGRRRRFTPISAGSSKSVAGNRATTFSRPCSPPRRTASA
jgi:cytochrome P450